MEVERVDRAPAEMAEIYGLGDEVRLDAYPGGLPAFVRPQDERLAENLAMFLAWFRAHKHPLDLLASVHGALLFRGFPLRDTADFQKAIDHYPTNDLSYVGGAAPRNEIAKRVLESTHAPKDWQIILHQEMAYLPKFPRMISFFCRRTAWAGGETTLANFRELKQRLPERFWNDVKARGVQYERNFRAPGPADEALDAMHKTWCSAFQTEDTKEAERACRSVGLEPIWREDGSLSTLFVAPGFIDHPLTGETVWFNHIAPQSQNRRIMGEERWAAFYERFKDKPHRPYGTTYGDGGEIDPTDLDVLFDALESLTLSIRWKEGDLMLIDNIVTAHGRNPYEGMRNIQVALLG